MNKTLLHALATETENGEGGYAVRHGKHALSDFGVPLPGEHEPHINPMAAAYPCLFPFWRRSTGDARRASPIV